MFPPLENLKFWTGAGRVFDFDSLPRYDALASAKKAEVGFDSLSQPCSESRRTPAVSAVFSFAPPVYGGSDGEPKGSPVPAGAARSVNPFEPPPLIDSHGGGCSKPQSLEANMAQSPASGANALAFQSTTFEVVDQQGQPWLRAREIAAALGYADEDAISRIYARRSDEFTDSMTCTVKLTVQGQDREVRIFSLRGAHLLAMFARTKIAKDFRRWVLDVLEKEGAGVSALPTPYTVQPSDTLTEPQQIALRALLESNVKRLPHDKQAGAMVKGWSKLKAHFGVPYRQIPASEFTEAISIVARHVAEWELVEDNTPKAGTVQEIVAEWVRKIEAPNGYPASLFQPIVDAVQRKLGHQLPPGKMIVDRQKLAAVWSDLGKLRNRIDGLGMLESDLPPSWWRQQQISA